METIAVYWEPKIKTYGIAQKTGLCMVSMTTPLNPTVKVLETLEAHPGLSETLVLISAGPHPDKGLRTCLVFDGSVTSMENQPDPFRQLAGNTLEDHRLEIVPEVEIIYFHGPHYGDRYGIASTVFTALMAADVPLLASACSASSIYLVVPKGQTAAARSALSHDVVVPQTESKSAL